MAYEETLKSVSLDADASLAFKTSYPQQVALSITNKALTTNVVTLTTATSHGLTTGQSVNVVMTVGDADKATLDGTYVVASVPSETTFTYAKTASNITSAAATGIVNATVPAPAGKQYRFVKLTAAHTVGLCTAATNEVVVGVAQNKPQIVGASVTVATHGISLVEAGAAVTAGEPVKLDSVGRVINATRGTDAAVYVGVAIQATTAAGQLVPVLLRLN